MSKPITIRLPADEEAFYREQAATHRMSISAYLTRTLVRGVTAENMLDFEERMQRLIGAIPTTGAASASAASSISDDVALSVFTCEALLTVVAAAQNQQVLYKAQEAAKAKIKRMKGGQDAKS